jgi:hypothetical protein
VREHGLGNYRQVDDTPLWRRQRDGDAPGADRFGDRCGYGGTTGPVEDIDDAAGERFDQPWRASLSAHRGGLLFIAGRYGAWTSGFRELVDREISIGDYVLSGARWPRWW